MKNVLLIFTFVTFFCSLQAEGGFITKKQVIDWLENNSIDTIVTMVQYDIIQKIDTNKIGYVNTSKLKAYYQKKYNESISYSLFIAGILEEKIKLPCYDYVFDLDESVTETYNTHTLDDFINAYCIDLAPDTYSFKTKTSQVIIFSVLYYLFQHDYFPVFYEYWGYCAEKIPIIEGCKNKE